MFSYHLYQKKLKVIFRNNLKKILAYFGANSTRVVIISKLSPKIVRKWCKNGARIRMMRYMGKGKEGEVIAGVVTWHSV